MSTKTMGCYNVMDNSDAPIVVRESVIEGQPIISQAQRPTTVDIIIKFLRVAIQPSELNLIVNFQSDNKEHCVQIIINNQQHIKLNSGNQYCQNLNLYTSIQTNDITKELYNVTQQIFQDLLVISEINRLLDKYNEPFLLNNFGNIKPIYQYCNKCHKDLSYKNQ